MSYRTPHPPCEVCEARRRAETAPPRFPLGACFALAIAAVLGMLMLAHMLVEELVPGPDLSVSTVIQENKQVETAPMITLDRSHIEAPLVFAEYGEMVAALRYDVSVGRCYQEGDISAAYRVLRASYDDLSERYNRLRWGDPQVEQWKRDALQEGAR